MPVRSGREHDACVTGSMDGDVLNPFVRLGTKLNRRIFATVLGIAFCLAYLTGTMSMASGLHNSTETVASTFDQGPGLIYTDENLSQSFIDSGALAQLEPEVRYVAFTMCIADVTDATGRVVYPEMYVVSVYDPTNALGMGLTNESDGLDVLVGTELAAFLSDSGIDTSLGSNLILSSGTETTVVYLTASYPGGTIFADDWLIVPRDKMDELRPDMEGEYSFLLILGDYDYGALPDGLADAKIKPTSSVVNFFENGIYQVESNLWAIVLATGIIVCLLVYSIMSIETEFNIQTIEILRGLGAKRRAVVGIFMFKALIITAMGGVLGLALGFCLANAVTSASALFDITSIIVPLASMKTLITPLSVSLVAGLVGGFLPSLKASKMFSSGRLSL